MEAMFDIAYLSAECGNGEPVDIPITKEPVWVLGKMYSAVLDLERIRRDITSIIWFTYRKGFVPIGNEDGLTSDKGWGCMLRCGQMVLGVALTRVHLAQDWFWCPETRDPTYLKIVQRFEEKKQAPYSIHQIALMGSCEGREVGQWFGPNTVAQVIKKLVVYDQWSSLVVHVALDNTVVKEDIVNLCKRQLDVDNKESSDTDAEKAKSLVSGLSYASAVSGLSDVGALSDVLGAGTGTAPDVLESGAASDLSDAGAASDVSEWRPLLLIVPLRLGLSDINPVYINGLKICFQSPQSIGIIGGKPNQALYLIGSVGDEVIYLDPHTTQKSGHIENKETDDQKEVDGSYHCKSASRIPFEAMDPSVAVCFLCRTEAEFESLCDTIVSRLMCESQPLFEMCELRPPHWPSPSNGDDGGTYSDFDDVDRQFDDSDEEFEILC